MLLSIIIPTYNRYPLLREAIQSVINQEDVHDLEILVVDDGSIDKTPNIVQDFPEKVRYFRQEHAGLNAARNLALTKAQGEFVALLDDDDLWLPFKSNLEIEILNAFPDKAFIYSDFYIFYHNGDKIPNGLNTWFNEPKDWNSIFCSTYEIKDYYQDVKFAHLGFFLGNIYEPLLSDPHVLPSTAVVRRDKIAKHLKFPEYDFHCGDWDFFSQLSRKYDCIFLPFETTLNRSHSDKVRLTQKSKRTQLQCRVNLIERIWKSDIQYYQMNSEKVENTKNFHLLNLAQYQLLEGDYSGVRITLQQINRNYSFNQVKYQIFQLLSWIPHSGRLLQYILKIKEQVLNSYLH